MCKKLVTLDAVDRSIIEMHERMSKEAEAEIQRLADLIQEHKQAVWNHLEAKYQLVANEDNAAIAVTETEAFVVIPCRRHKLREALDAIADMIGMDDQEDEAESEDPIHPIKETIH